MDLRMVKTRRQIKEAFMRLRERYMPERIKVKDICQEAMINKTTFYNHYTDSIELSNEIDDYAIDNVMMDFSEYDLLLEDPKAYVDGLLHALERESENLKKVFWGKQEVLCAKLEERLYRMCESEQDDLETRIRLSFSIGGFVRVVKDYLFVDQPYNVEQLAAYTTDLVELLLKQHRGPAQQTVS